MRVIASSLRHVCLHIRRRQGAASRSAILSAKGQRVHHLNKSFLLVEDSALDVALVLHAAQCCGIADRFVVVRDGLEALDYLTGIAAQAVPALVLLDLHMPRCDGFEVLKILRATPALSEIAVVMMTSSDSEADRRRAALLGVKDYIVKTHELQSLIEHVQRLSGEYLS